MFMKFFFGSLSLLFIAGCGSSTPEIAAPNRQFIEQNKVLETSKTNLSQLAKRILEAQEEKTPEVQAKPKSKLNQILWSTSTFDNNDLYQESLEEYIKKEYP